MRTSRKTHSAWSVGCATAGLLLGTAVAAPAERINEAGRILGPLPALTNAVLLQSNDSLNALVPLEGAGAFFRVRTP